MSAENSMDLDDDYVKISCREGSEYMEFPMEDDGTLLVSTIQAQFPNAIGLKYRSSSGTWRAIRESENILNPPKGGWGNRVYCLTVTDSNKRRFEEPIENGSRERKVPYVNYLLQDLAVIGLPYKTTDQELKDYFEMNFGELAYSEIKHDRETGKSRGFGFIRFKDEAAAKEAVKQEHYMDGRKVEVRQKKDKPMKMFIGRLAHGTTVEDLDSYFSQYGELTDTYIPQPFRNFAFITFASSEAAKNCMQDTHVLGGSRINVMERNPQEKDKQQQNDNMQDFGNNSNSAFSGGFNSNYNPKEVQHNYSDYNTSQGRQEGDLKQMLFQFLASQK